MKDVMNDIISEEGPLYKLIEDLKDSHESNQSLVYLLEYSQGCLLDDSLIILPDSVLADDKHCVVKFIYEDNNGDYLHIVFLEGKKDDVQVDCVVSDASRTIEQKNCGWDGATKIANDW